MYRSNRLFDEMVDVERNINTGKVDHTPNYHKDVLDAVVGATFTASKNAEQYAFDYGETLDTIVDVSMSNSSVESQKKQMTVEFEQQLQEMLDPIHKQKIVESQTKSNDEKSSTNTQHEPRFLDFGMGPAQVYKPSYLQNNII